MKLNPPPPPVVNPLCMATDLTKRELYALVALHGMLSAGADTSRHNIQVAVKCADVLTQTLKMSSE
jgi:hypothetical protein